MNEEEQKRCDTIVQGDGKPAVKLYDHIPEDQHGMFGVHVSGFTVDVTERCLRETFQTVGKVHVCKVITVRNNIHVDEGPGYIAFIKFKSEGEAYKAMEKFDGYQLLQNCTLSVRPAFTSRRYLQEKGTRCSEESRRNSLCSTEGKQKKIQKQNRGASEQSTHSKHSPSSSNPVSSITNESGRKQCQENGSTASCNLNSTDQDGEDIEVERQDSNSTGKCTSLHNSVPETVAGITTDYRLREGLLERKDVANFNSALGNEQLESVADGEEKEEEESKSSQSPSAICSEIPQSSDVQPCHNDNGLPDQVAVPTRGVHDMQHKTGPCRTSPPKQKRTQPNVMPPAMTNSNLSHSNPNAQLWSQGQLPTTTCHNNNNNGLPDQVPVSTRGVHDVQHQRRSFRTSPPKQTRTQPKIMPHATANSYLSHSNSNAQLWSQGQLPMHSNDSFIHSQIPSALSGSLPCHPRHDVSPSGRAKDATIHLTSSMSQLRIPGSTSPISTPRSGKDVTMWSAKEVADYVRSSECSSHADFFLEQDIDGQALMLLERGMLLHFMKVGPALKLLQVIDRLKKSRTTFQFSPDQTNGFSGW